MRKYRIAYFTTDWNYELVEATLHGLKRYVDDHENVSLYIFDCFGKDQSTPKDKSEYAIFDLPDLRDFDGLLIQGNQIVLECARNDIARRAAETGIPAVSIDCPIPGCTLIGVDNRASQYDLTAHVIRDHGARHLTYLTGIIGNGSPEGEQRRDGFLDACREYGVSPEDIQVIECTWRTSDGYRVAEQWIREGRALPDAFICGNDDMALGVISALTDAGVRIPEQVIVTGYDNISSAALSTPQLSTIQRDFQKLNYSALDTLIHLIEGRRTSGYVPFAYGMVRSESCGCPTAVRADYIRDQYFRQSRFLKDFYSLQDRMVEELFEISSLTELRDIIRQNHEIFGCDNVFICINDYYFDNYEKGFWQHDSETFGDNMVLTVCGRNCDAFTPDEFPRFPTRQLLPAQLMDHSRFLMFYPLHYNTYSIGYLVMDGISEAARMNLHKSVFSFLEIAIENVRKKSLLRHLNEVLDDLYVHDSLTGLYNRFGLGRYGHQTLDALIARDGGAQILFMDMDNLKDINDRLGHEYGDEAIHAIAGILRSSCDPVDFVMRYGGDEFLVIASTAEADLESVIQREIAAWNHNKNKPYTLSLSTGTVQCGAGGSTLEECIQTADARMYENKLRRKAAAKRQGRESAPGENAD